MGEIKGSIRICPPPHQPAIKDLVPDLSALLRPACLTIQPWLKTETPAPDKELEDRAGRIREKLDGLGNRTHPVRLLLHLLSGTSVEPGPLSRPSLAPARLSLGWSDSRDEATGRQPRFTRLKGIRAAARRFGERISYTEKGHERIPLACYSVAKTKNATPSLLAGG